jgi:hypothetical protein
VIKVKTHKRFVFSGLISVIGLFLVFGVTTAIQGGLQADADAQIINVTTSTDEDSHPDVGDGCSLYESTIAAATASTYGGCEAGDAVGPNTIQLESTTYTRDVIDGPLVGAEGTNADRILELENVSLLGVEGGDSAIEGYWPKLLGNDTATLEYLSFEAIDTDNYPSTNMYVDGSNKTINDVYVSNKNMVLANIYMSTGGETVDNVTFSNFRVLASDNNMPAVEVDCRTDNACSNINFNNASIESNFSTSMNLDTVDNVSIIDSDIVAQSSGSSTLDLSNADNLILHNSNIEAPNALTLNTGTNASLSDVGTYTNGGDTITLGAGTTIDGYTQSNSNNEGGSTFQGSADSISGLRQIGTATAGVDLEVSEFVDYVRSGGGSVNLDISGAELVQDVSVSSNGYAVFATDSSIVKNIDITSSGSVVDLEFSGIGAEITDVYTEYTSESSNSYPDVDFSSDNITVDGLSIIKTHDSNGEGQGALRSSASNLGISNLKMVNSYVTLEDTDNFSLDKFSINGPSHLAAMYLTGAQNTVNIENGYVTNSSDGISLDNDVVAGSSAHFSNIQFGNIVGTNNGADGSIIVADVDEVTINDVSIYHDTLVARTPILISEGTNHKISNTTILDSTGGIGVHSDTDGLDMNLDINNVTVVNNEDSEEHDVNIFQPYSLVTDASGTTGTTINLLVQNSIFGGVSEYSDCNIDEFTNITVQNSITNSQGCTGFSIVSGFGTAASLADNGGQNSNIGFEGEQGKLQTLALQQSSPAVGFGNAATCEAKDARGVSRLGAECDAGAFQLSVTDSEEDKNSGNSNNNNSSGGLNQLLAGSGTTVATNGDSEDEQDETANEETSDPTTTTNSNTNNSLDEDCCGNSSNKGMSPLATFVSWTVGIIAAGTVLALTTWRLVNKNN